MRGLGGLSLFLLVGLAALIWAVTWGPWRDLSFRSPVTKPAPATSQAETKETQPVPARKVRAASGSPRDIAPPVTAPEVSPPPVVPAMAKPTEPQKFPTAVDVPIGTLGSMLLDSFGPPVGRTIGVDEGGRTEIFVYRRTRPDTATVIHLRNGRVASAVTTAY